MAHFLDIVKTGFEDAMDEHGEIIDKLAQEGQKPEALVIGCTDSRVAPELITGLEVGDGFGHRPMGAIIPEFNHNDEGENDQELAAKLQFEVEIKGIKHIVLMGHTECGAAEAMAGNAAFPRISPWLSKAQTAKDAAIDAVGEQDTQLLSQEIEKQIVIMGINNLQTYPDVQVALEAGKLELHGMLYDMKTKSLLLLNQDTERFEPFASAGADHQNQHEPNGACCD